MCHSAGGDPADPGALDLEASPSSLIGRKSVVTGKVLIIPPYGAQASTARFDSDRLSESWPEATRTAMPQVYARLRRIATVQKRGMFLGRLGRTSFNLASAGNAEEELARRSIKGDAAVQAIRFSGQNDIGVIEQRVADEFLAALASGNAESVAALMDPVPFGNMDLRNGGSEARLAMAKSLIAGHDWATLLREARAVRSTNDNDWAVSGPAMNATLTLRPMGDFIFVRMIELGEQS